jgi:hypothetical protein
MIAKEVARRTWPAQAVRIAAMVVFFGGVALGCRRMNGQHPDNDTNGPGPLSLRLHDLSGPGVRSEGMRVSGGPAYSPWGGYAPASGYPTAGGHYGTQTWPSTVPSR